MEPNTEAQSGRKMVIAKPVASEKCPHGNEKGMGCCGYDELAVKPATTRPITFGTSLPKDKKPVEKTEPEMGARPSIQAKAMPSADMQLPQGPQPIPTQPAMGGRIPDSSSMGMGMNAQARGFFDGRRPQAPQQPEGRPRVMAVAMGQQDQTTPNAAAPAPAAPPPPVPPTPPKVEAILKREAPPEGITKTEAQDLASALTPALESSGLALAEGEQCFGIDNSALVKGAGLRDGLLKFATTATDNARLQIEPKDITLMEQVLDCSSIYENKKKADSAKTVAFVAGGLLVGAAVLWWVNR